MCLPFLGKLSPQPVSRRLVFEQPSNASLGLDMAVAGEKEGGKLRDLSRAFGRLRMTRVTFPYRGVSRTPREAVIKALWIEPFIPQDKAKTHVVMQLQEDDVFPLQALSFSAQGLVCDMVGTTNTVLVGQQSPHENQLPSWFEYIVKHVIFQTLCKPLKVC